MISQNGPIQSKYVSVMNFTRKGLSHMHALAHHFKVHMQPVGI